VFNQALQQLTGFGLVDDMEGLLSVKFITEQMVDYAEYCRQQSEKGKKSAAARKKKQPVSTNNRTGQNRTEQKKKEQEQRDRAHEGETDYANGF
jgi:hypothetical protein